jgi:hypothetical protein
MFNEWLQGVEKKLKYQALLGAYVPCVEHLAKPQW